MGYLEVEAIGPQGTKSSADQLKDEVRWLG